MTKYEINEAIREIDSFILRETGIDIKSICEKKEARDKGLMHMSRGLLNNTKKFEGKVMSVKAFKTIQ